MLAISSCCIYTNEVTVHKQAGFISDERWTLSAMSSDGKNFLRNAMDSTVILKQRFIANP